MYLIKNGTVHTGDGTVQEHCDVLTDGKTIKAVMFFPVLLIRFPALAPWVSQAATTITTNIRIL